MFGDWICADCDLAVLCLKTKCVKCNQVKRKKLTHLYCSCLLPTIRRFRIDLDALELIRAKVTQSYPAPKLSTGTKAGQLLL